MLVKLEWLGYHGEKTVVYIMNAPAHSFIRPFSHVSLTIFCTSAAYASLNLSLLHYSTFSVLRRLCRHSYYSGADECVFHWGGRTNARGKVHGAGRIVHGTGYVEERRRQRFINVVFNRDPVGRRSCQIFVRHVTPYWPCRLCVVHFCRALLC